MALNIDRIDLRLYDDGLHISMYLQHKRTGQLTHYEKTIDFPASDFDAVLKLIEAYQDKYRDLIVIERVQIPINISTFKAVSSNNWPS